MSLTSSAPSGFWTPERLQELLRLSWEELQEIRTAYLSEKPMQVALLIGSTEWIARERTLAEEQRRRFVATKVLRREYGLLDQIERWRVNGNRNTVYGKELDAALINYLELLIALRYLPEAQRHYWTLYACEGMDVGEMATLLDVTENAAKTTISKAASLLVNRIFDPMQITILL